ncbi:MAG: flagellar FliJ family protein [Thermodesulfobacteriota bacterium]
MSPAPRFRFSLETVLKVKGIREEQARHELALTMQRLERSRQALADTEQRVAALMADLQSPRPKEWLPEDFQMLKEYLDHLKVAIVGWQERIQAEEAEVEEKRLHLQRLHQERRLLEQLRAKKYTQFKRDIMKTWEKETEAITLGRWPGS